MYFNCRESCGQCGFKSCKDCLFTHSTFFLSDDSDVLLSALNKEIQRDDNGNQYTDINSKSDLSKLPPVSISTPTKKYPPFCQ